MGRSHGADARSRARRTARSWRMVDAVSRSGCFGLAVVLAVGVASSTGAQEFGLSAHVIGKGVAVDGDTLDVGDVRIRLFGVDAAEMGQRCRDEGGREWRCGRSSARRLAELLAVGEVDCAPDGIDGYGRVVAHCAIGGVDLGSLLVAEGLAWAFRRYADEYGETELAAKAEGLGIWAGTAEPPWDYRGHRWETAAQIAPEGCPIKGNVSGSSGERIYHTPWSQWYARTSIDEAKGERWFCDEAEAVAAGWREAGR